MNPEIARPNDEPATLTMRLHDPGMSLLHRAGLGGLACALRYIERAYEAGDLPDDQVPGTSWNENGAPWSLDATSVTLNFGDATAAGLFLRRLFALAFQIDEKQGVIYLPGQFLTRPSAAVLAAVQSGLTLTFLQHGRVRKLAKKPTTVSIDPQGDGRFVNIEYKRCEQFKHQEGWRALVDKSGRLIEKNVEVIGPLSPGSVVRHVAFTSKTRIVDPPERILPLYFAMVGCLALSINRGSGVLVIPEVEDIEAFTVIRPIMSPTSARQCRIASAGDATLQAQLRLKLSQQASQFGLPGCHAATFRPTSWASQQKSRVDTLSVPSTDESHLRLFEIALEELPPRIATVVRKETKGRGKKAQTTERVEYFWSDSIVRPLVADNLARGQPWYSGFVNLMTKLDPVSKKPFRLKLYFEREGLKAMTEKIPWHDQGESAVVRAVHEALRRRFGAIASENKGKVGAMKNRMTGEFDKWRLAFAGAKTVEQFRHSLCDLFARAGMNSVLREQWEAVLPWLGASQWQLTRDLALLALASYSGSGVRVIDQSDDDGDTDAT